MGKTFVIQAIAAAIAVLIGAKIVPGVRIRRTQTAIAVAAVFAILNLLIGWLLTAVLAVLLAPFALFTLGLVYLFLGLLVNALLLYVTDKLIDDFEIRGLSPLVSTAALISFAAWLLPRLVR